MPMVWPGGGGVRGELVELGDLDGREGRAASCRREAMAKPPPCAVLAVMFPLLAGDAKVGLGLGTVVEAEDGVDRADELGGQGDAAFADAVGRALVGLVDEGDAEGLLHGGDGAGELDGAAFGAGSVGLRL